MSVYNNLKTFNFSTKTFWKVKAILTHSLYYNNIKTKTMVMFWFLCKIIWFIWVSILFAY